MLEKIALYIKIYCTTDKKIIIHEQAKNRTKLFYIELKNRQINKKLNTLLIRMTFSKSVQSSLILLSSSFREGTGSFDPISRANRIKSLPNLRYIRHPPPSILIYNRNDTSYVREQYMVPFIKIINS